MTLKSTSHRIFLRTGVRIVGLATLVVLVFLLGRQSIRPTEPQSGVPSGSTATGIDVSWLVLPRDLQPFLRVLSPLESDVQGALSTIETNWDDSHAIMLVEVLLFVKHPRLQRACLAVLLRATRQNLGPDPNSWLDWIWKTAPGEHPDYALFKAALYQVVDPRFREYFDRRPPAIIRLDEIRWGGVVRDGIPPLKNPKMIPAPDAAYLEDGNIVFGVAINGDARAYPKRILAWHEMFKDTIGGKSINGVYCTLCGSMIVYGTVVDGVHHELGTSGFLYRSNKLMYDHATQSLWSTLTGKPVVGSLAGKGIELETIFVVTTTWGQWRKRHPDTQVLSLDTGYRRDYGEGVAYRDYFSHDRLMFTVPRLDQRLANKAEVLALRFGRPDRPLAVASKFLTENPVYHDKLGEVNFVVLTDPSGAHRVFETYGQRFIFWDGQRHVTDDNQNVWQVSEDKLSSNGEQLNRLPAHRVFWFGWFAVYPKTRLVK